MQCHICERDYASRLPFNCATCARNALYELRLENTCTLIEKEALGRQVEGYVSLDTDIKSKTAPGTAEKPLSRPSNRWEVEQVISQAEESLGRIQEIQTQAKVLQKGIEDGRARIAKLKAALSKRRSDYESATHNLAARRDTTLEQVRKSIRKTENRWNTLHIRTAEARVFLCREAANLYGLKRRRKKGGVVREEYSICGVTIVDLRDLNNASPAEITTSITHIAHLLVLVSHYLSLRLPAEITLPHRDYPLPTIFRPSSSYSSRDISFPSSVPQHSSNSSPSASRLGDQPPLPKPRPLYIDKPLPVLVKDDPGQYSLFVEGVTLLAWDIAWVCRSQGLHIEKSGTGGPKWEDVCPLGKNLWLLLVAPPQHPPIVRSPSHSLPSRNTTTDTATPAPLPPPRAAAEARLPLPVTLGQYSHGTAHSFLGSAGPAEYMRGWKLLQGLAKIIEPVKSALLGEMTGAEWEMLDEKEWEGEAVEAATAATAATAGTDTPDKAKETGKYNVAGGVGLPIRGGGDSDQISGAEGSGRDDVSQTSRQSRGTSGWTKLKNR